MTYNLKTLLLQKISDNNIKIKYDASLPSPLGLLYLKHKSPIVIIKEGLPLQKENEALLYALARHSTKLPDGLGLTKFDRIIDYYRLVDYCARCFFPQTLLIDKYKESCYNWDGVPCLLGITDLLLKMLLSYYASRLPHSFPDTSHDLAPNTSLSYRRGD